VTFDIPILFLDSNRILDLGQRRFTIQAISIPNNILSRGQLGNDDTARGKRVLCLMKINISPFLST
jgi:hypothetical protein